jgi:outer membrane autotransporter protein
VSNSRSDILTIGGNFSGTTLLSVHDTNPGLGVYNPVGIPVIIVGGVNTAVVTLDHGPIVKGLFDFDVFFNANKNIWVLASTPNQAANELPRLITAAQNVWQQSSGVWADRTADLRATIMAPQQSTCDPMITKGPCVAPAPTGIGPGAWVRAFGDWSHNGGTADETLFGKTHSYDVTYKQNVYGVQVGLDVAAQRMGYENFVLGIMAGAVDSKVDFASGTNVKFGGGNVGLYATLINRGLFVDALVMANFMNVNYVHTSLLTSTAGSVESFGGHVDVGYRFYFGGYGAQPTCDPRMITKAPCVAPAPTLSWFAEPLATIDGVWSRFNKIDIPGVALDLNNNNDVDVRGRLGGRVGATFYNGSLRWEPSLTASVWTHFMNESTAQLISDCYTLNLIDADQHKTYGEVGLALNVFDLGSRWNAYIKGDYRFAEDYWGGSIKGGARFQW